MFMMAHRLKVGDIGEPILLRGEVLAITAAMITRLESEEYKEHNITPVSYRPKPPVLYF